jgi:osmotically inducible protein OsmC
MAIAVRRAETVWEGTLAAGQGSVRGETGALGSLPVTWAARTEQPDGKTSPEELAAAAHSACFAMALALRLGEQGTQAERISVASEVRLDEVEGLPTIVSSGLTVRVTAPDLDDEHLQDVVDEAARLCPVSRLFAGAQVTVQAELETS